MRTALHNLVQTYTRVLRACVLLCAILSGASVVLMMLTTCSDVALRFFGRPIQGSYDVVSILGALAISFALPYTTAVKGHVAVEFFFHRLSGRWRVVVDSVIRLLVLVLFGLLAFGNLHYGLRLADSGQVTPTLQLPMFWIPFVLSLSCVLVALVVMHNLLHPGKVLIEP